MARVVDEVAAQETFKHQVSVTKVVTRTMEGAKRYQALCRSSGNLLPVPSIIINGELVFKTTPGVGELKTYLNSI